MTDIQEIKGEMLAYQKILRLLGISIDFPNFREVKRSQSFFIIYVNDKRVKSQKGWTAPSYLYELIRKEIEEA